MAWKLNANQIKEDLCKHRPGSGFFISHQGAGGYLEGRTLHLLPVSWVDNWPIIGEDTDGDGIGEMVWGGTKPINGFPKTLLTVIHPAYGLDRFGTCVVKIGLNIAWMAKNLLASVKSIHWDGDTIGGTKLGYTTSTSKHNKVMWM